MYECILNCIGEFGLVYKGIWTYKNIAIAVKTLRGGATDDQRNNFLFEASGKEQRKFV